MACSLVHLRGNIAFINDGIIIPHPLPIFRSFADTFEDVDRLPDVLFHHGQCDRWERVRNCQR
jgi:hypothetical protein